MGRRSTGCGPLMRCVTLLEEADRRRFRATDTLSTSKMRRSDRKRLLRTRSKPDKVSKVVLKDVSSGFMNEKAKRRPVFGRATSKRRSFTAISLITCFRRRLEGLEYHSSFDLRLQSRIREKLGYRSQLQS